MARSGRDLSVNAIGAVRPSKRLATGGNIARAMLANRQLTGRVEMHNNRRDRPLQRSLRDDSKQGNIQRIDVAV